MHLRDNSHVMYTLQIPQKCVTLSCGREHLECTTELTIPVGRNVKHGVPFVGEAGRPVRSR